MTELGARGIQSGKPLRCPVCDSPKTQPFFSQLGVPTQCGYLAPTREEAKGCELGDIRLHHCETCTHIWNSAFDPAKMQFNAEYEFSQFHSAAYRAYVASSIERLKERYGLAGGTAIDIACGKGDFLRMLIEAGFESAIGFDPTFVDGGFNEQERQRITVYRRFYGEDERHFEPDLVSCRSALQYMTSQRSFLDSIRRALDTHRDAVVYFEVPNGAEAFREKIVWYVMYEAGCFFSAASLARIFRESGFEVLDVLPALGNSHLEIEVKPGAVSGGKVADALVDRSATDVAAFAAEYAERCRQWSDRFGEFLHERKTVVLWAAGMRAISLLVNVAEAARCVEFVVDVNPQRQGRYLPKTAQQVIGPESLAQIRPDVVIATNPNYAAEIQAQLGLLGVNCQFEVLH